MANRSNVLRQTDVHLGLRASIKSLLLPSDFHRLCCALAPGARAPIGYGPKSRLRRKICIDGRV